MVQGSQPRPGDSTTAYQMTSDPSQTTMPLSPAVPGGQIAHRSVRRRFGRTAYLDDGTVVVVRGPGVLGRGLRALLWVAGIIAVVSLLLVGVGQFGLLPHLHNPFASRTTTRTQTPLLLSIQNLSRFEAASGNFQVVVDSQVDAKFIPDLIYDRHMLLVAVASVDAFVDFSQIGQNDITVSADRRTATIHLPAPELEQPNIDRTKSYPIWINKGLFNRITDLFSANPGDGTEQLYQIASVKISSAAIASGLPDQAETNTRAMLKEMLSVLGYTTVTVTFAAI